ncbi:MAG: alpha/beta hydrolase [Chloroflexota bacterium]|nr:alpha/beta hydrolase [Chloroflexota bacterium]
MHLTRDGVRLAHDDAGSGSPPIVFVHGWCCDRSYLAPQMAHFSRSHRCMALDLRGHGESDAPEQEYSIAGFADDIAWTCAELAIEKPVVVGHSMGGAVALSLAVRHPELPAAIVMLDGALVWPATMTARPDPTSAALHSDACEQTLANIFTGMFLASDVVRKEQVIAGARSFPRHVAASEWDAMAAYDSAGDAAKCRVPALYVGAAAPIADMRRLRELMPHVALAQTAGAGHFHQLEVPDQVNAMIERFMLISGV